MADPPPDAAPSPAPATPTPPATVATTPAALLRPRREAFERGLLPIPKLIFPEGTLVQTLAQLKEKLAAAAPGSGSVGAAALAEALKIPQEQAALALGTLAAVLPAEDPALGDSAGDADIRDVLLFLYIQSYKRLVPRSEHKDSSAVADVWPSTSALDGYLSALSPMQLVRSNSRSQTDEEIYQLSYLQNHMTNILTLLADSVDCEGDDSLVLTMETFEHLGFLVQFSEGTSLSQAATFFANSDPDMPASAVPAAQVLDWMSQNIASALEYSAKRSAAKESDQQTMSDLDVTVTEANTSHPGNGTPSSNPALFVEGFSKTSVVKHASDVKGNSIKGNTTQWIGGGCMERKRAWGSGGSVEPKRQRMMLVEGHSVADIDADRSSFSQEKGGGVDGAVMERKRDRRGYDGMRPKRRRVALGEGGCDMLVVSGIEGDGSSFSSEEYIHLYTTIGKMSMESDPDQMCERYKEMSECFLKTKVLPLLKQKDGELLLREIVLRWKKLLSMVTWLSDILLYINGHNISEKTCSELRELSCNSFFELVFNEMKAKEGDAGLSQVAEIFKEYVLKEVMPLLKKATFAGGYIKKKNEVLAWLKQNFVQEAVKLHEKYIECVSKCFEDHPVFCKVLKEAFEALFDKDIVGWTSADLFAAFCNDMLNELGRENFTNNEVAEKEIEKVVKLLTCMHNKDVFLHRHRRNLQTRLLFFKNISDSDEMLFLLKLRQYFGGQCTSSIDGILKDLVAARKKRKPHAECKLFGGGSSGPIQSDDVLLYSLDTYFIAARTVQTSPDSGLSFNQLVQEFFVPWNLTKLKRAKYTPEGYSVFGGLVDHVINAHENNKSWNGKITTKMFFICQGQVHIFPWAVAKENCSSDAGWNDLYALLALVLKESALATSSGTVYPLHLLNLGNNFKKLSRASVLLSKVGTYIRCNPAFLSHSQNSCVGWHLRRFELSKKANERQTFRNLLEPRNSDIDWSTTIRDHPLFKSTFEKGRKNGLPYGNGYYDLYRFVRDWHTHCHQNTLDTLKIKYGFEILEFIAEVHFGSYLSEVLFMLLTGGVAIDEWLNDLKPALPIQRDKYKDSGSSLRCPRGTSLQFACLLP